MKLDAAVIKWVVVGLIVFVMASLLVLCVGLVLVLLGFDSLLIIGKIGTIMFAISMTLAFIMLLAEVINVTLDL